MKIVISCANRKNGKPLVYNKKEINFISHVDQFDSKNGFCSHPDDLIDNESITWRDLVAKQGSHLNYMLAYKLYKPSVYKQLFDKYNNDLYIYSAGWGIVRADFKLPKYDITFSKSAKIPEFAKRNINYYFNDFNQLQSVDSNENIVFIGGIDYVNSFCKLTKDLPNKKIIIYTSQKMLKNEYFNDEKFEFIEYNSNTKTNWQYEFAKKLIRNEIDL